MPPPLAERTTSPITTAHTQTRTPARIAVGRSREYAVRASPSPAPSRNGHAVCQTP